MKKIILSILLLSCITVTMGQSVLLDPSQSAVVQVADSDARLTLNGTDGTPYPSLQLLNNGSSLGYLYGDYSHDGVNLTNGFSTAGFFWKRSNSRAGIGTFDPEAKLHIYANGTGTVPQLKLTENNNADGARIMYENFSSTNNWTLYGLANDVSTNAHFNIWNPHTGNILTVRGDGNVGILNSNPTVPLHINSGLTSTSSSTGAMILGVLTGGHLTFDNNEINAYSNTLGTTLRLNEESTGDVYIGGAGSNESDLRVYGFTRLGGSSAPNIKMKKISGTTGSTSQTFVAHGLTEGKILDVSVLIDGSNAFTYPPSGNGLHSVSNQYRVYFNDTNIYMSDLGSSMQSRPYRILITYEE